MKIRTIALASAVALVVATPAFAGDGWYAGFGVGEAWGDATAQCTAVVCQRRVGGDMDIGRAPVVEVDYGYKWADAGWWDGGFRLEAEIAYAPFSVHAVHGIGGVIHTNGNLNLTSAFLNLAWDWPIAPKWALTFGGGVGITNVNPDVLVKGQVPPNKVAYDDDSAFSWQLLGGVTYAVDPNVDLQLDYRYQSVGDTRHSSNAFGAPAHTRIKDLDVQTVKLSIRWYYNYAPPPPPPAPTPTPPPPPPAPKVFIVFFDFDKSNLTAEAQAVVAEAVQAVKAGNVVHVMVTGHTDTVGSHEYNQALSERRAEAVKAEMLRLGLSDGMIATAGRSFDDPMVQTGPGVREPQNRRAVIELGK
jgi:outer membrane protein OmpA-like peptidoglycan-associated protein